MTLERFRPRSFKRTPIPPSVPETLFQLRRKKALQLTEGLSSQEVGDLASYGRNQAEKMERRFQETGRLRDRYQALEYLQLVSHIEELQKER